MTSIALQLIILSNKQLSIGFQNSLSLTVAFEKFIRSLLCAVFLEKCSFAIIETDDEDLAFDTFDALNTTGVPLTSIQTLKPQVMQHIVQVHET